MSAPKHKPWLMFNMGTEANKVRRAGGAVAEHSPDLAIAHHLVSEYERLRPVYDGAKFGGALYFEPANIAGANDGTVDQFWKIKQRDLAWPMYLAMIGDTTADRTFVKVEGGNPAPWDGMSDDEIIRALLPWQAALGVDVGLIADGFVRRKHVERVGGLLMPGAQLAPGALPFDNVGRFDAGHPSPVVFATVANIVYWLERWPDLFDRMRWDEVEYVAMISQHAENRTQEDDDPDNDIDDELQWLIDLGWFKRGGSGGILNGSDADHALLAETMR